jgi:hypothetical protein
MNDIQTDLHEQVRAALITADFLPAESIRYGEHGLALTEREVSALNYYVDRGWDALRAEDGNMVTWVRWSEDGIELMNATLMGVIHAEARFSFSPQGVAWMRSAVQA